MSKSKAPAPPTPKLPEWPRPDALTDTKDRITFLYDPKEREKLREFAKVYKTTEAGIIRAALKFYLDNAPDEVDPRDYQEATDDV